LSIAEFSNHQKWCHSFFDPTRSFSYRCTEKFGPIDRRAGSLSNNSVTFEANHVTFERLV